MDEKQLIKELQKLNRIKPNKHWTSLCKRDLFEEEKESSWLFVPIGRHALLLSSLVLVVVAAAAGLTLFSPSNSPVTVYDNFNALVSKFASQGEANEVAVSSLEEIRTKLEEISVSLDNLKNVRDPGQALAMTEVVKGTAKRGTEAIERIKQDNGTLSKQVLASLVQVEEVSKNLEQRSSKLQQEMFEAYLAELQQRDLNVKDKENLEKAESYYNEGKLSEAMIFIMKIGIN